MQACPSSLQRAVPFSRSSRSLAIVALLRGCTSRARGCGMNEVKELKVDVCGAVGKKKKAKDGDEKG